MNGLREWLRTLCDLDGVIGGFLLSDSGGLVATDLPPIFDAAAFAQAGPRIVRLADLGAAFGEETRFFVIRFTEYKLFVRVVRGALLGVLLTPAASMPALRAATGVVARRLEPLLGTSAPSVAGATPAPPSADTEAPLPQSQPTSPSRQTRRSS